MLRLLHRMFAVGTGTIILATALAPVASAQSATSGGYQDIHRLGGSTSFHAPPLKDVAGVKRMANARGVAADIRKVLADNGIPETSDAVVAILSGAASSVKGGSCAEATPVDGQLVECDFQPGGTLEWMAYRPNVKKGSRVPGRLERVRWAGKSPFKAFLFRVTDNNRTYTFVLPKECSNLSLMGVQDVPRVVAAVVAPPPPPPALPPPPAPAIAAPPPPPPPPPPPAPALALPPPQAAPPPPAKASPFFIDALVGKDRRVRPIAGSTTINGSNVVGNTGASNTDFAQCSPLFGLKIGVAKRFQNDWEVAGAAGIAISLVNDDNKVREHEVFVDVEANKYVDGGVFLGTGLSLWDLAHSDTFTPAWMVHVGVPLTKSAKHPVYFLVEGRVFFDHTDDLKNNYQFWGGVRIHL